MRAVAILLVVAAHAKVTWLAGGFVGVDVFFVLSGYLITGLLVREIQSTRDMRFAVFYARRLRRLLPALLLMLGTCGVLGSLLITPEAQIGQAAAARSAAAWLSNFHFAFAKLAYFSPGAKSNLFLHTWSLGVEEQFYLVWPLFLVFVLGAWEGAKRLRHLRWLKWAMAAIFALSLVVCVFWTHHAPRLGFYMMPSRAWQFALGALVFLFFGSPATTAARGDQTAKSAVRTALYRVAGVLGLALIVASALLLNGNMPYPGLWALLPAVGTAAVLAAGAASPRAGIGKLLSLRPMQAVGHVSYSWYLWHWPVLLLGASLVNEANPWIRLALVTLSFILATASYRFVETPIRCSARIIARPRLAVSSSLVLMAVAVILAVQWNGAAMNQLTQPAQLKYLQAANDAPVIYHMGCDDWYHSAEVHVCGFGDRNAGHTAVAMGDSVALQWFPAILEAFNKPGWRLLVLTKSSCPMVDVPLYYERIHRIYANCAKWRRSALKVVAGLKPDVIILGSTFTYDFTRKQWIGGTTRVLQAISSAAEHIYILRSTPLLPFNGPACLAPRSWLYMALSPKSACVAPAASARSDVVYRALQMAADNFMNVSVVDMNDAVCPDGECRAERNGMVVFRDERHLSATFARSLATALEVHLQAVTSNAIGANLPWVNGDTS
ncbi:MAG TPA: acyltransferase family protein [Gammaproteobacteria bacterium]|nr:acyltransferase family protein [Gammaproteobacteria bacterium]